jgi:TonB-dependent starch-binding outer membrane protein SusC
MKSKLLRQVIAMSKITLFGMIIQCILYGAMIAGDLNAQNLDKSIQDIYITLDKTKAPIGEVLKQIERETGFIFAYNIDKVDLKHQIMINGGKSDLATVLMQISKESNLKFKRVNNNIHIGVRKRNESLKIEERINEQERTITGRVISSEDNSGLPGVNVIVQGTGTGTITDIEGNYAIQVPDGAVLEFSSVGFNKETVEVGSRSVVDVSLTPDITQLSEIVVIGYGQRERKDLTGAISQIGSDEIKKQIGMSPEFAMQGRMPGVFVSNPGSNPTARPEIRIRGIGTLGFNDPLYVVDGVPLTEGGANPDGARMTDQRGPINVFALINPNDIESISVLKDASATAIYGVRAANGVILITTKRGQQGKARVDVSANFGFQNIPKVYDVTDVKEYEMLSNEAFANRNFTPPVAIAPLFDPNSPNYLGDSPTYTNDWQDAARVQNARIQEYNMSISGGNAMSNYSVGVGYSSQENALYYSKFDRYSLAINSDHKVTKWLTVGETYRFVYGKNIEQGGAGDLGSQAPPWQPLYDDSENGLLGYARTNQLIAGANRSQGFGQGTQNNFMGLGSLNQNQRQLFRNLGSVYAEATLLKGLRVRGTYSFDYYTNSRELYQDQRQGLFQANQGRVLTDAGNTYSRRGNENVNLVGEFLVGYNANFNKHHFDLIFNAMDQRVYWNVSQAGINANSPLSTWDQRRIEEGWFPTDKNNHYERIQSGLMGYMGRLSYHYDSKYYLDATVRRDGSSKFGPGYKWGTFPSFAAAWRISAEQFMQGISVLSDLKIRAGWGKIGNQETLDFAYLSRINVNPKAAFGLDPSRPGHGVIQYAAAILNMPTPNLTWETVSTSNIGIDSEWLGGKIRFTAEYYNRITDGILQEIPVPGVVGIVPSPVINLAQVTNRGIELDGMYTDKIGDVNFNFGFNFTTVKNRVEQLYNNVPRGGDLNRVEVGYPMNFIFGYKTDGIFQTQEEVDAWKMENNFIGAQATISPGDVKYVDFARPIGNDEITGDGSIWQVMESDGIINDFDRTYLGNQIPGFYGGISLGAEYKGFDANLVFRFTGDVQKVYRRGKEGIQGGTTNYDSGVLGRWTPENPSNTIPRAIHQDPSRNNLLADRFVEDAGFLRFQNLQVGYSLNQETVKKLNMTNARIFLMGQNLFVLSPYGDLDPENITTPRVFTIGANLSF